MVKIKSYLSSNFSKSFLTIFLPFFLIISLVYLVKISTLTSQIQITFTELLTLYSYSIPDIIFYVLPLSFIAALTNILIRLSQENELIALYAVGLKSKEILHRFILLGLLFSFLLLSISFFAMPLTKQFYKSFKEEKKSEAKLNISAGKLGQKFGNYYIYVKKNQKGLLQDIVIYNHTNKKNEQFFSSQTGEIKYHNGVTSLLLNKGYGYTYAKGKLQQVQYHTLEVFDSFKKSHFSFETILSYWKKALSEIKIMHRALFFVFVSLIPFLCVYPVASFTMINPRYQNNHSFSVIFITTFFLYMVASSLEKWGNIWILFGVIGLILLLGQWIFNKRVSRYF